MISRVADSCLWLGRYLERAESTARMLAVTSGLAVDAELSPRQCWLPAVIVTGEEKAFIERFGESGADDGERVQDYLTWDERNHASLWRSLRAARENARSIREVVSLETWQTLNELHLRLDSETGHKEYAQRRQDFYTRIARGVQLCLGLMRSTMLHEAPLQFIWLGVMLERVGQTARLLDVNHHALVTLPNRHQVVETSLWLSLLRACSGFEPFMKRHQGRVSAEAVARFLIHEPRFPRSVRFCLDAALEAYRDIRPPEAHDRPGGQAQERLHILDRWLAERESEPHDPEAIHGILTQVVDETAEIGNAIGRELLGYPPPEPPGEAREQ